MEDSWFVYGLIAISINLIVSGIVSIIRKESAHPTTFFMSVICLPNRFLGYLIEIFFYVLIRKQNSNAYQNVAGNDARGVGIVNIVLGTWLLLVFGPLLLKDHFPFLERVYPLFFFTIGMCMIVGLVLFTLYLRKWKEKPKGQQ